MGNPIKNAEKIGTVPVLNQINANKITLITGVVFKTVKTGVINQLNNLYLPARVPKIVANTTIIIKLSRAL